jgi:hypothetical protein
MRLSGDLRQLWQMGAGGARLPDDPADKGLDIASGVLLNRRDDRAFNPRLLALIGSAKWERAGCCLIMKRRTSLAL